MNALTISVSDASLIASRDCKPQVCERGLTVRFATFVRVREFHLRPLPEFSTLGAGA